MSALEEYRAWAEEADRDGYGRSVPRELPEAAIAELLAEVERLKHPVMDWGKGDSTHILLQLEELQTEVERLSWMLHRVISDECMWTHCDDLDERMAELARRYDEAHQP